MGTWSKLPRRRMFNAAREGGKHMFTVDPDYIWYGMPLTKV